MPLKCLEERSIYQKARYQLHKEKRRAQNRARYANNRECIRAKMKADRRDNPDKYRRQYERAYRKFQQLLFDAKARPCHDCHKSYPIFVMEFDHTRGVKKFTISEGVSKAKQKVIDEIAKCDIVCANCHNVRTHRRRNGFV